MFPVLVPCPLYIGGKSGGILGSNGRVFGKLEYVVLPLTGLVSESLDTPPMGDERGVPYVSK